MASNESILTRVLRLAGVVLNALVAKNTSGSRRHTGVAGSSSPGNTSAAPASKQETAKPRAQQGPSARSQDLQESSPGEDGPSRTREVNPRKIKNLKIAYNPVNNGLPDAGEILWTWVPYEENDGRGKDRPVLVIGRHSADRVYVVKMTSKSHSGRTEFIPIGSGAWDSQGRPSYVDIDQVYSVHHDGARREASELPKQKFDVVASALRTLYGWA